MTIIFLPKAEEEFYNAIFFYDAAVPGLGEKFISAVEKKLLQIAAFPKSFKSLKRGFREVKTEGFPYLIIYKIKVKENMILVVSVFHTRRNPRSKYK
jgi:plasmid stabilization system protein ParE